MTAITVGKRYKYSTCEAYFTVKYIGDNYSFVQYDEGLESLVENENFYNGLFIKQPETRKVTVYLRRDGQTYKTNMSGEAIASRVVEFEIGKFEKVEDDD